MDQPVGFGLVDVCLIITGSIWGINSTAVKYALQDFNPLAFNALRFVLSCTLIMTILYVKERSFRVERRDIFAIVLTGLLGNTLYQIFFINGINLSNAGNTSLVLGLMPVCIIILAQVFHKETIPAVGWIGIAASLVGVIIVNVAGGATISFGSATVRGDMLTFLGVFCWSIYTTMTKPLVKKYSPLKVTALTMVSGTFFLILYAIPYVRLQDWSRIRPLAWAGLGFSFSLGIVFAYIMWSWGIARLGGARTAVYENVSVVTGVLCSWLLMGEPWNAMKLFGAALTLSGLAAVRWIEFIRKRNHSGAQA